MCTSRSIVRRWGNGRRITSRIILSWRRRMKWSLRNIWMKIRCWTNPQLLVSTSLKSSTLSMSMKVQRWKRLSRRRQCTSSMSWLITLLRGRINILWTFWKCWSTVIPTLPNTTSMINIRWLELLIHFGLCLWNSSWLITRKRSVCRRSLISCPSCVMRCSSCTRSLLDALSDRKMLWLIRISKLKSGIFPMPMLSIQIQDGKTPNPLSIILHRMLLFRLTMQNPL